MPTVTATEPTPARWSNTGGDVTVHLVPAGTEVLVDFTQEEVWRFSFQVASPVCGRGVFHGSWQAVPDLDRKPFRRCDACFPAVDTTKES